MYLVASHFTRALVLVALSVTLTGVARAQQPAGVGVISFPTSGSPEARQAFLTGLAWLHSFEYEQALESFQKAQTIEPDFAMAYWGEAICYQQFLWGNEDPAMARQILGRFGATPEARARRATSPRERAWLASLDVLFGSGDRATRLSAYAEAMRQLAAADPTDPEAAAFHGLALMATASRGLAGHHGADGSTASSGAALTLAGSNIQQQAAAIFNRIMQQHPRHPGALHYLIHVYDDPAHAELALDAASTYAGIAPESSHARHMPAHVFVQLGRWADAATSDAAAFAASDAMVKNKALPSTMRDYHALSWLVYEYLQLGRFQDARRALDQLAAVADKSRLPALLSLRATLRARVVVEEGTWNQLASPDYVNYDELFAVGLSAIKRGDFGLAELARQRLADMAGADRYRERRPLLEIMARGLSGQLRLASGDADGGLAIMREAVALELALPSAIGPPALIKPSYELLAEMLLDRGNAREADTQFAAGLNVSRNRSALVLGRARAAAMMGDREAARRYYSQFLENWQGADGSRPELAEARAFLAENTSTRPPSGARYWPLLTAGAGVVVALVFVRRRRSRAR
jgi:tetratricopeptide (TPR) repeat protein